MLLPGDAGLRAGETRGLHGSPIDRVRRRLTAERSEYEAEFTTPKYGAAPRVIQQLAGRMFGGIEETATRPPSQPAGSTTYRSCMRANSSRMCPTARSCS